MQFRPEYIEATDAARYNFWFWLSVAMPWLLVTTSAAYRKLRIFAILFSYPICWLLFCVAVEYYWNTKLEYAVTETEMSDATADTGRLFGPVLVGIPLVAVYVSAVSLVVFGADWTIRTLVRKFVG